MRILITLLGLAASFWVQLTTTAELPFHLDKQQTAAIIIARTSIGLPPGIQPEDHLRYADQSIDALATLIQPNLPVSSPIHLIIDRAGHTVPVATHAVPQPANSAFLNISGDLTLVGILSLALVTMWRGRNWAAWGLSLLSFSVLFGSAINQMQFPPPWNLLTFLAAVLLTSLIPLLSLYITATALIGRPATSPVLRDRLFILALILFGIIEAASP
ncbi:MAG: hypothetical protein POH28_15415, partial [Acidocella sp.]|nr:hypothetical protein [Acidocella sp.]